MHLFAGLEIYEIKIEPWYTRGSIAVFQILTCIYIYMCVYKSYRLQRYLIQCQCLQPTDSLSLSLSVAIANGKRL